MTRKANIRKWNEGLLSEMVLHPKSAAHGLNMQEVPADVIINSYYSEEGDSQVIKRVHRSGQKESVNVWRPICNGTVDEKIVRRLTHKAEAQDRAFVLLKQIQSESGNHS